MWCIRKLLDHGIFWLVFLGCTRIWNKFQSGIDLGEPPSHDYETETPRCDCLTVSLWILLTSSWISVQYVHIVNIVFTQHGTIMWVVTTSPPSRTMLTLKHVSTHRWPKCPGTFGCYVIGGEVSLQSLVGSSQSYLGSENSYNVSGIFEWLQKEVLHDLSSSWNRIMIKSWFMLNRL